jgi:hypothetical protein
MKKPVVHQILRTWWCLLVIDVVADIIYQPFQHALSKLGLVVHRRTGITVAVDSFTVDRYSLRWTVDGFSVDGAVLRWQTD